MDQSKYVGLPDAIRLIRAEFASRQEKQAAAKVDLVKFAKYWVRGCQRRENKNGR